MTFVCTWPFWGEVAKLAAQLGGALLIAWLTVQWALGRYKAEKLWERETTALVDLLTSLGDLDAVNAAWIADLSRQAETRSERDDELRKRYWGAKTKVDAIAATATVLLPNEMAVIIDELLASLNKHYDDWQEDLFETQAAVGLARTSLIKLGRARLRGRE